MTHVKWATSTPLRRWPGAILITILLAVGTLQPAAAQPSTPQQTPSPPPSEPLLDAAPDGPFSDTFDGSRRFLAIDPSVTNTSATDATQTLEQGRYEGTPTVPVSNVTVGADGWLQGFRNTYDPQSYKEAFGYNSTDTAGLVFGDEQAITLTGDPDYLDSSGQPTDPLAYPGLFNTIEYIPDLGIYQMKYRVGPQTLDVRMATSIDGRNFTRKVTFGLWPMAGAIGTSLPSAYTTGAVGGHGFDSSNIIVRDTTRGSGSDHFRPFFRDNRGRATYPLNAQTAPEITPYCLRDSANPGYVNHLWCYQSEGFVRRGVGTYSNGIHAEDLLEQQAWNNSAGEGWTTVFDPLSEHASAGNGGGSSAQGVTSRIADGEVYFPAINHYYDNLVGLSSIFRRKLRTEGESWKTGNTSPGNDDGLYPSWAFSPGGDAEWIYPDLYQSAIDLTTAPFSNVQSPYHPSDRDYDNTDEFQGQLYASSMVLNEDTNRLLVYASHNPVPHDRITTADLEQNTPHLFSYREDGFAAYTDSNPADTTASRWTTAAVTVPDNGELHVSADANAGSWTVEILRPDLTPFPGYAAAEALTPSGSSFIGDDTPLWTTNANNLSSLAGKTVVLRFAITGDAKVYGFGFDTADNPEPDCEVSATLLFDTLDVHRVNSRFLPIAPGTPAVGSAFAVTGAAGTNDSGTPVLLNAPAPGQSAASAALQLTIDAAATQLRVDTASLPTGSDIHDVTARLILTNGTFTPGSVIGQSFEDFNGDYEIYDDSAVVLNPSEVKLDLHWGSGGTDGFTVDYEPDAASTCVGANPGTDLRITQDVVETSFTTPGGVIFNKTARYTTTVTNVGTTSVTSFSTRLLGYDNQINGVGSESGPDVSCTEVSNVVICDFAGVLNPGESEQIIGWFDVSNLPAGAAINITTSVTGIAPGPDLDTDNNVVTTSFTPGEADCAALLRLDVGIYRGHTRAANGGFGVATAPVLDGVMAFESVRVAPGATVTIGSPTGPAVNGQEALVVTNDGTSLRVSSGSLPAGSVDHELVATLVLDGAEFTPGSVVYETMNTGFQNQWEHYNDTATISENDPSLLDLALHWRTGVDMFTVDFTCP